MASGKDLSSHSKNSSISRSIRDAAPFSIISRIYWIFWCGGFFEAYWFKVAYISQTPFISIISNAIISLNFSLSNAPNQQDARNEFISYFEQLLPMQCNIVTYGRKLVRCNCHWTLDSVRDLFNLPSIGSVCVCVCECALILCTVVWCKA